MDQRRIPPVLWVSLISMGAMVVAQLAFAAITLGWPFLLGAGISFVLLYGLWRGSRLAYLYILVMAGWFLLEWPSDIPTGRMIVWHALFALVWVPMVISSAWFWRRPAARPQTVQA